MFIVNWVVLCVATKQDVAGDGFILHSVLYENEPFKEDLQSLLLELMTDETLGMMEYEYQKDYEVAVVRRDDPEFTEMFDKLNIPMDFADDGEVINR